MTRLRRWLPELLLGWVPSWQERRQREMARRMFGRYTLDVQAEATMSKEQRMSSETKATLEIFIAEVEDRIDRPFDIKRLIASWVMANDLHPEKVVSTDGLYTTEVRRGWWRFGARRPR